MKSYRVLSLTIAAVSAAALAFSGVASAVPAARAPLPDIARQSLQGSSLIGRIAPSDRVTAALTLPLRNEWQLAQFLQRVSNPSDPDYGHYLTPAEFAADYSPTVSQYQAAIAFAESHGLTVTGTHASRLILDVAGSRSDVEQAFGVRLYAYRRPNGTMFRAPDTAPSIPAALAGVVSGVVGLSTANVRVPFLQPKAALPRAIGGGGIGTGPLGGMSPSDIRAAYGITPSTLNGSGQTLAVFELDSFTQSDISAYESSFNLPSTPIQTVLVDQTSSTPGSGADEVTLDMEMQLALASGASKMLVYEAPNTGTAMLDAYSRIADDDIAKEISTSWGLPEGQNSSSFLQSENAIFEQMAAQGQSIFAAAGDNGAYDTGSSRDGLTVDDPGSQPYVCCAGGTTLSVQHPGGAWASETTWNAGSITAGATGGGASAVWPIPTWQKPAITSASKASTTQRNVPDVSIDADPNTGYSIYFQGSWVVYGGTSCSAPLWTGIAALVNQQRAADGKTPIGQFSPAVYPLLSTSAYDSEFHDIADGSTNLYYPAVTGYDDATGLGTPQGASLIAALAAEGSSITGKPSPPTNLSASAGSGFVVLTWTGSTGAITYNIYRSLTSGTGWTKIGSTSATTYDDTSAVNGTTYYYVVTASDAAGESGPGNSVSATPQATQVALTTFPAGLDFISLPWSYTGIPLSTIFGYVNPTLAVWNPATAAYSITPTSPANEIVAGAGYWVRCPQTVTVTTSGAAPGSPFGLSVQTGWNQIGDPFTGAAPLSSITVLAGAGTVPYATAVANGWLGALIYSYDPSTGQYVSQPATGQLSPYVGYWIEAADNVTLEIPAP